MPNLLIDTPHLIMFDIPAGKKYVGQSTRKVQKAQIGNTCEFYAYAAIRPRLGKEVDSLSPASASDVLLSMRRKEKLISAYRKNFVKLELPPDIDHYPDLTLPQAKGLTPKGEIKEIERIRFFNYAKEFSAQTKFKTFKDYIQFLKTTRPKQIAALQRKLLTDLNCDPDAAMVNVRKSVVLPDDKEALTLAVGHAIVSSYSLTVSAWQPKDGITGLINSLRTEGPLCIGASLSTVHFKVPPQSSGEQSIANYEIFYWPAGSYEPKDLMPHKMNIIGAEKNKDGEFVYFIDPSDESKPGQKRRIYKISYQRPLSSLLSIYGHSGSYSGMDKVAGRALAMQEGRVPGPFAFFNSEKNAIDYEKLYQQATAKKEDAPENKNLGL